MPISSMGSKTTTKVVASAPASVPASADTSKNKCCHTSMMCAGHHCFGKKIIITLIGITLAYVIFFLGTLISNNIKKFHYIGLADKSERMITVNGVGKVNGQNNIAMTSIGFSNTDKDVAKAQADNKAVMDKVFAEVKKLGIEDKDLQSNYTIYPEYNYLPEKGQELKGYKVSNSVTIKIRDLTKISSILELAGKFGATEVGGLTFTIDDSTALKDQARIKALNDAGDKAKMLAEALGVKLGKIVSYYETDGSNDPYMYGLKNNFSYDSVGMGGAAPAEVAGGSKDVIMNVSVVFELAR